MSNSTDQKELMRIVEYLNEIDEGLHRTQREDKDAEIDQNQAEIVQEIQEAVQASPVTATKAATEEIVLNPDSTKSEHPIVWFPCEAVKNCPGRQAYKLLSLPNGVSRYQCLTCKRVFGVAVGGPISF